MPSVMYPDRMRASSLRIAAAALVLGTGLGLALAGGKDKDKDAPKPCVAFAKTWQGAIEEAKALNVPIVLHSHGFY